MVSVGENLRRAGQGEGYSPIRCGEAHTLAGVLPQFADFLYADDPAFLDDGHAVTDALHLAEDV